MTDPGATTSLREATLELNRYLSGEIAPLFAIDAVEPFLSQPPHVAANIISEWMNAQYRAGSDPVPVSDLIFHALKKIHDFAEFDIVPREKLQRFMTDIARLLLQICPAEDRDDLKVRISRIGEAQSVLTSRPVEFLHRDGPSAADAPPPAAGLTRRAAGVAGAPPPALPKLPSIPPTKSAQSAAAAAAPAASAPTARDMKRLAVLLDRLERVQVPAGQPVPKNADTTVLAQTFTTAALDSKTADELEQSFRKVEPGGNAPQMGKVFRALSWNVPGWTIPGGPEGEAQPPPPTRPIEAMNKIVALAPDAQERAKRWGEMVYAAIEQLNEGRLAQAVSIIEAAKRVIAEKQADATIVKQVLAQAQDAISEDVLRRNVENPEKHGLVRKVLEFFPGFRAESLLDSLDGEMRRERRKILLALLECHGRACRDTVLTRLAKKMGEPGDETGFYKRNLAYLLRRIPRDREERLEEEILLLASMIDRSQPAISAKEAIGALGQLRIPEVEKLLVRKLRELESQASLGKGDNGTWELLDRVCGALARHGSKDCIRAVAAHAFNRSPVLGDTMARFEQFSRMDLSVDPEQLAIILDTIKSLVPSKVLGIVVVKKSGHDLACLMQAVSGTPTDEVRLVLRDIATRLNGHALGEQAQKALSKLDPKERTGAATEEALSGDLELFGLPGLLQSLETSQSTGELFLFDKRQVRQATVTFAAGKVVRSAAGKLTGEDALYQIFEKPFPGTFSFRANKSPAAAAVVPEHPFELLNVILEGLRRHDEYQLARALAPEGVSMERGSAAAVLPEDETDAALAKSVWAQASAGAPPEVCEAQTPTDPFRVRRLLAHWVEQGALKPRLAAAAPA